MNIVIGDFFKEAETGNYEVALTVHNCAGIPMPTIGTDMVQRWPVVTETVLRVETREAHDLMGRCVVVPTLTTGGILRVACLHPMLLPGRPRDRRFDYGAFETAVVELDQGLKDNTRIILTRMGVGAHGGRWGKVRTILTEVLDRHQLTVVTKQ